MLLKSRHILTNYIVKRPYLISNTNTNVKCQCFIDYDKYVQDTYAKDKQINDIHVEQKQKQELKQIQNNLSELNQNVSDQTYWIFHSVALSYVGLFAYIFKM